ncbi:sigma-70 family RNA polymerase sigma factor [Streptomyces sp. NBC_00190]|uniref:RNA polymerase sigma factor n=1 Tax=unclassified Streptomyces TaxID=2593676 RepID=UPI002E2E551E|nr:sigma-70 family RNA polymerase sigma factor [Streptomyces sp. NBC_00190]WSZ38311.1 sigma-70 family RNA polymerase sigma factor [Streptomyces sp. NBC_00868]
MTTIDLPPDPDAGKSPEQRGRTLAEDLRRSIGHCRAWQGQLAAVDVVLRQARTAGYRVDAKPDAAAERMRWFRSLEDWLSGKLSQLGALQPGLGTRADQACEPDPPAAVQNEPGDKWFEPPVRLSQRALRVVVPAEPPPEVASAVDVLIRAWRDAQQIDDALHSLQDRWELFQALMEDIDTSYRAWRPFLLRFVRARALQLGLSQTDVDPEGVVQDAFVATLPRWAELDDPKAYLFVVARRLVGRAVPDAAIRASAGTEDLLLGAETHWRWNSLSPNSDAETVRVARAVVAAIAQLPERQRIVSYLGFVQGWSGPQIAAYLECPASTVRANLHLVRSKFYSIWFARAGAPELALRTRRRRRAALLRRAIPLAGVLSLTAAGVAFADGWWRIAVAATVTACVGMRVALGWLPLSTWEAWSAWFHWLRNSCTRGQRNRP